MGDATERPHDALHLAVVIATKNRGKLSEFRALLGELPIQLVPMGAIDAALSGMEEDADTFEATAMAKAKRVAAATCLITLADASGLEIDALAGRPGVRSTRFAKEGATDAENNAALLAALEDVEDGERTARFRCVLALVDPWADSPEPVVTEGRCEGEIARQTRGGGGFGYDSLFIVDGGGRTMAELDDAEKREVSHRALALSAMRPHLERTLAQRLSSALSVLRGSGG
jgi:XTP/dITP diphosphohydrolase